MVLIEVLQDGYVRGDAKAGDVIWCDLSADDVANLAAAKRAKLVEAPLDQFKSFQFRVAELEKENLELSKAVDKLERENAKLKPKPEDKKPEDKKPAAKGK